ncbi:MAG TPA: 5-oxoprolinase subunit PxpA [Terracidiphilus sp.]|nr:5-oxoprolinase subunit PxpA [Terracidiphilus sp.]
MTIDKFIDLNSDMGEVPAAISDGTQEATMRSLTSVNIACGGHAGDEFTMRETINQALRSHLAIGAHPGYPDRQNFGRIALNLSSHEVAALVAEQVSALSRIADECGARVTHVKAHGALYNQAVNDRALSAAIAQGVRRWGGEVVLVGLAGSEMLKEFRDAGFRAAGEAFADRRYEPDGTLRSRQLAGAMIANPAEAAAQAVSIAEHGKVRAIDGSGVAIDAETICIHGDTPGAASIAAAVADALRQTGFILRGLAAS